MMSNLSETRLYSKALGCLLGGLIGDAMGTPTEGMDYDRIAAEFGWVDDFSSDGTDDTVMKNLLAEALIRTDGYATLDDWAQVWLDNWNAIFGVKLPKFFVSVVHTAQKLKRHAVPRMAALGNMPSSSSAMCISPVGIVNACNPAQAALQAYNLAGLIHIHDVGFCQDGAAAMAAGVAEAMKLDATVESVLDAAQQAIIPASGADMLARIETMLALAREADGDYRAFCEAAYSRRDALVLPHHVRLAGDDPADAGALPAGAGRRQEVRDVCRQLWPRCRYHRHDGRCAGGGAARRRGHRRGLGGEGRARYQRRSGRPRRQVGRCGDDEVPAGDCGAAGVRGVVRCPA